MKPEGTVVPLIRLNEDEVPKVLDEIVENIHGVLVGGRAGGGDTMPIEELEKTIKAVKRHNNELVVYGGAWFIDGTGEDGFSKALAAQEAGADYVVIPPPQYDMDQGQILDLCLRFAKDSRIEIPRLLYVHPGDKNLFGFDTIKTLAKMDNIVGIKTSYDNFIWIDSLCRLPSSQSGRFNVLVGEEKQLFFGYLFGAKGNVSTLAHLEAEKVTSLATKLQDFRIKRTQYYEDTLTYLREIASDLKVLNLVKLKEKYNGGIYSGFLYGLKQSRELHDLFQQQLDIIKLGNKIYKPDVLQGIRKNLKSRKILS